MKTIYEHINFEMKWYRRLWRWLFPIKATDTLSKEDILKAIKILDKNKCNTT